MIYGQPPDRTGKKRRPRRRPPGSVYAAQQQSASQVQQQNAQNQAGLAAYQAQSPPPAKGVVRPQTEAEREAILNPGPVAQPPPLDPAFQAQQAAANLNIQFGNAWDQYQTGQIENQYGLGLDTSNPYSRAKLLEESYTRSRRGTTNSLAAQGQLYSGAMQTAQDENLRNYSIGKDTLSRERQAALDAILKGNLDRYGQVGANIDDQTLQSLLAALGGK